MYGIIYCLTCTVSGKMYVGQTVRTLAQRWTSHFVSSRKVTASGIHNAIRKYGGECFLREVVDIGVSKEDLDAKEAYWIRRLGTLTPGGYNLKEGGGSCGHFTAEARARMSQAAKQRPPVSDEARESMRRAALGKPKTPEHVRNAVAARQKSLIKSGGFSESAKKNIANARKVLAEKQNLAPTTRSPEARARISAGLRASWALRRLAVDG